MSSVSDQMELLIPHNGIDSSEVALTPFVRPAGNFLLHNGNCGVVALHGARQERFLKGLKDFFRGKCITAFLQWPAEGTVQGGNIEDPRQIERAILGLNSLQIIARKPEHLGILVVDGVDYNAPPISGTPELRDPLLWMIKAAKSRPARRSKSPESVNEPMVLALGRGVLKDLPTTPGYTEPDEKGFAQLLKGRFALEASGEVTSCVIE